MTDSQAELSRLRSEVESLKDHKVVHLNMLRGGIGKLTPAEIGHLYRGEEAVAVLSEVIRQNPEAASLLSSLAEENERLRGAVARWKDVSASAIKCLATATDMLESLSPHPMMTVGLGAATRELRRIQADITTHPAQPEGEGHE